ncbi:MAG: hypothetical protein HW402_288 [Dehalococcoidales bacterium]|nr:hypothetical protein [Dehalococcoidales bacterium]
MHIVFFLVLGICFGISVWQLAVWLGEVRSKRQKYRAAQAYAQARNKPLLVVGGPWGNKPWRRRLNMPAHAIGDVCLDIDSKAIGGCANGVVATVVQMPFGDKSFGAVFVSHVLEHLPSIKDAEEALSELSRVAEAVFIAYPSRESIAGWVTSGHHLWLWQKGNLTYLSQRGRAEDTSRHIVVESGKKEPCDENDESALNTEARLLAQQLFGHNIKKSAIFVNRLLALCAEARDKEFIIIHNPGGWGSTPLDECLAWEKSVVDGVTATVERMGYRWLLRQYFRSGSSAWAHLLTFKEQVRFFFNGEYREVRVMAAELQFITRHLSNTKVILVGISQGAAFSNAVMRQMGEVNQIYSIELGLIFPYMSRRVVTERTLAMDNNGIMPDPISQRDLWVGFKAYIKAPFWWVKYRLQGRPQKFSHCINTPGHDYSWEYPEVRRRISEFLKIHLGIKRKLEVGPS